MDTKKLRQKILDLAIRGKLVPQDPNDEPASVLLERIRAEKEQLIKEGKIKRTKKSNASDTSHYENVPYKIPCNWCWTTLGEIGTWQAGATPSRAQKDYYGGNIPWLKTGDLTDGYIYEIPETITNKALEETSVKLNPTGSVLIAMYGATIGKTGILTFPATTNQACCACVDYKAVTQKYLFYFLLSHKEEFIRLGGGGAQPNISKEKIVETFIPIPPIAEQGRLVNEIEKLFSLVGMLDSNTDKLRRYIALEKEKILHLAITGKLLPQEPADEPAITLLKKINPNYIPCDNRHYRQLSDSWETCQLKDIFDITMGQSPAGDTINGKYGTEFHQGKINFTNKYLAESAQFTTTPSKIAAPESLLLCVRAPVGIVNITKREICIGRGLCSLRPKYDIDSLYWLYMLSTLKDYFEENATGSTFKAISGDIIRNASIPFPPLSEQRRILSKINELFCLLDKITAEL